MSIAVGISGCGKTVSGMQRKTRKWIHVSFRKIQEKEMDPRFWALPGCGKTTLMKMVNRLYDPTSGEIHVFGENIQKTDPVQLRRKIGYVTPAGGLASAHDR
ncbi:MAG: ATP-binding cassette domain-containing protein [Eubacterium ramulus]